MAEPQHRAAEQLAFEAARVQDPSHVADSGVIEHFHGAATRVEPTATAFPHRSPGYNLIIISEWADPAQTEDGIAWARQTYDALRPHMADAAYVNYLDADDANRVRAAYGPNYQRLGDLKLRYDPENLFHLNQNIPPPN